MGATQKKPVSQSLQKLAERIARQLNGTQVDTDEAKSKETEDAKSTNTGLLGRFLKR